MSSTAAKDADHNLVLRSNLPISVVGDTSFADDGLTIGDTSSADDGLTIGDTSSADDGLAIGDTSSADGGLVIGDTSSADSGLMIGDTSLVIASVVDDVNGELSGALDKSVVGDTAVSGEPAGDGIAELSSFAASVTAS